MLKADVPKKGKKKMVEKLAARQPTNVVEDFPLYDTVQIRAGASNVEGYVDYRTLGGLDEVPFFTVRNRSEVGYAMTNKESKDSLPFAFGIHSIGVSMYAPMPFNKILAPTADGPNTEDVDAANFINRQLPLHTGLVLRIREDEKLISTMTLTPSGSGMFGVGGVPYNGQDTFSNGWPDLANRFKFQPAINVPRAATLMVSLRFSRYARLVLAAITAAIPGHINPIGSPTNFTLQPACGLMRVSLLGRRAVQQRGELTV